MQGVEGRGEWADLVVSLTLSALELGSLEQILWGGWRGSRKVFGEGTLIHAAQIRTGRRNPEYVFDWSRAGKYLACMLPLACPALMADIANQSQWAVLGARRWLHSPSNAAS